MSIRLKMLFATLPALAACASIATVGTAPGDAAPPDRSHDVVTVFMDVPGREDAADALTLPDVAPVDTAVPPDVVPADVTSADATPDVIDAAVEAALDAADDAAPDVRDGAVEADADASVDTMPDVGEDVPVDRTTPDAGCTPTPERCNNVDDDCDGTIDNDVSRVCYGGPIGTAGVGACRAGTQTCAAGAWGAACVGEGRPATELCDGVDNNCDGTVDNPFLGGGGGLQILALSTTGCVTVDHVTSTGDDRGGIAATARGVLLTGDVATASFPLSFAPQTNTGRQYDALTSNLRTAQAYTLANGMTPIPYGGGDVTSLVALDGATGAPTGAVVTLSRTLTLSSGTGIFAGWDRVVLHDGRTSHVYNIALPSGTVTDLGVVAIPAHQSCETWAFWGVAEYYADTLYETYVRDTTTVERMAVPSGSRAVVATFTNLSDMCAFTVSPAAERWYFHHEGTSQFRSGDETAGFCDARIRWSGMGLGDVCYAGVGACLRDGRVTCSADGRDITCAATAGAPSIEVCNGLDDDCDGTPDDGIVCP